MKTKRTLRLGTVLALSLAFVFSAACFAPAFAQVSYHDHASALGHTFINIANHQPQIQLVVVHFDGGDHGVGDYLEMDTLQSIPGHGNVWVPVAIITDSPSIAAFNKDFLYKGLPNANNILLVKHCELQVYRIGKTVLAYWTIPVISPVVTLPPGCLLFKGYGCAQTDQLVFHMPNGVTLTVDSVALAAHATFVCPVWKYCGNVGDGGTGISIADDWWTTHA